MNITVAGTGYIGLVDGVFCRKGAQCHLHRHQ